MSLETLGVVVAIIMAIIGIVVQVVAVGIYVGKLDGFKTLTEFKFKMIDDKLDKHNNVIERTYKLEGAVDKMDEQIKVANHRIEDLEDKVA